MQGQLSNSRTGKAQSPSSSAGSPVQGCLLFLGTSQTENAAGKVRWERQLLRSGCQTWRQEGNFGGRRAFHANAKIPLLVNSSSSLFFFHEGPTWTLHLSPVTFSIHFPINGTSCQIMQSRQRTSDRCGNDGQSALCNAGGIPTTDIVVTFHFGETSHRDLTIKTTLPRSGHNHGNRRADKCDMRLFMLCRHCHCKLTRTAAMLMEPIGP